MVVSVEFLRQFFFDVIFEFRFTRKLKNICLLLTVGDTVSLGNTPSWITKGLEMLTEMTDNLLPGDADRKDLSELSDKLSRMMNVTASTSEILATKDTLEGYHLDKPCEGEQD